MSIHVNFSTHGKEINEALQAVLNDNDASNWLVLAYDKGTNDLRLQGTGDGGLEELNDEFFDGKMQYAYTRVIDPNTELPKYVFIAWCGSGVPETRKGFFNSHLSEVSRFFKSFHVQINARDEADVEPDLIMKRVSESSGANYSVHKEQRKPQPAVTPVNSVYKKTEIPDIAAMQRESMRKEGAPAPVGTNYKPVQTAPKPLASRWNAAQSQSDNGAAAVRAEREKFEREQREREEQSARVQIQRDQNAEQQRAEEAEAQRRQQQEDEQRRVEEQRRAAAAAEEERHRQEQEAAEARRQQEEEEQQRRAAEQEEHRRQQEQEEQRRRQEEQQRLAEQERKEAEEARRLEEERIQAEEHARQQQQQQQEATLHGQLDDTADRAVHAATAAAGSAVGHPSNGISAVVLFGYAAGEENEMTLNEGEVVVQIDQVDEGWWYGMSEDGKRQGLFPANYVQVLEEEPQAPPAPPAPPAPTPPAAQSAPAPAQTSPPKQDQGATAIALYDYDAGEDNEISFREGHLITYIEFVSDDWWQGVAADGRTVGLFPANYVELQK
ncbi:hypothetical protein K492DRAFT_210329 [Lichtheimia hyalospora FSU 10163]|nr:hypothetical protein K492DRAFT_210329 [Lichtheimia hyalospora FSU 10163]